MLACDWSPNTTYIEVVARERHRVKLIESATKQFIFLLFIFKKSNI